MEQQQFDQLLTEIRGMKGDIQDIKQEQGNMNTELQKTNEKFLSLEEKTNMIHLQAIELSEQHQVILSQLKNTAKKDDVGYTEKKILEHDREIFKIKKHLQLNS